MSFYARGEPEEAILIQLEESDGDTFFAFAETPADWARQTLRWGDFQVYQSRGNGRLEPGKVRKITFAEGSGAEGKTGSRVIYLTAPQAVR